MRIFFMLSGSETDMMTRHHCFIGSARVSQGRGVNGMDRHIIFHLGDAECDNSSNDETYGKGQTIKH